MSMGTRSARAGEVRPGAQAQWVLTAELASLVTILVREPGRVTAGGGEPLVRNRGGKGAASTRGQVRGGERPSGKRVSKETHTRRHGAPFF